MATPSPPGSISSLCGVAALATLIALPAPLAAAPPVIPRDVQASVQRRVAYGYTPSVTIGMVNADGRTTWSHGTRSWDDPTPADESTLYEIASVTKTFTAVLLAQMQQAGDVELADLVSTHLPENATLPASPGEAITLEHLATHHSGLPTLNPFPACVFIDNANPFAHSSEQWLYEFLAGFELTRAPGDAFEYSNTGIGLLGIALSHAGNAPFETLLKERVLTPLGMADTTITLTPEQQTRRAPGHAGYVQRPQFDMDDLAPAGGLLSTADDMLTYLEHNMALVPDSPLTAAMQESHQPRRDGIPLGEIDTRIGLVWWLWDLGDGIVQHGGDALGSAAFLAFRPSTGTGAVVLSNNRRHRYTDVRELGLRCLGLVPNLSPTDRPANLSSTEKSRYIGRYQFEGTEIAIGTVNDELTLLSNGVEATIYPVGSRRLAYYDAVTEAQLTFSSDGSSISLNQGGQNFRLPKITTPPFVRIGRDCDDIVLQLLGEPEQTYTLQRSTDGRTWSDVSAWSLRDPPYREPAAAGSHLFRLAP